MILLIMTKNIPEKSIVLFDGGCNFCNSTVKFILRHNRKENFIFIPLQTKAAKELLTKFQLSATYSESIVLIEDGKIFLKSTAVLRIARKLNAVYNWFCIFIVVPKYVRDKGYDWIAKYRNRWFGKQDSCILPSE